LILNMIQFAGSDQKLAKEKVSLKVEY
jgi:hypothetical protein